MRQKLITLDPTSWDLAQKKTNFSQWVRDQLRSEDNKRKEYQQRRLKRCRDCLEMARPNMSYCTICAVALGIPIEEEE